VSAPGKAFRFLQLAKLSLPVKVEKVGSEGNTLVQAGWSMEKDKFVVIILNYDDKDIVEHVDFSKLNIKNVRCSNSYCAYAKTMEDFNNPAHPDMVITESSNPTIEGMQVPLTAKGNSATYWVFDVIH
jgi:hypothetical protein